MTQPTIADPATPAAGASRSNGSRAVLAIALVLLLAAGGVAWLRHHQRDQEWRHGGDDVSVQARIHAAGGAPERYVVQVSWTGTPDADGSYEFILLDDRLSPPKPIAGEGAEGSDGGTGPGWDGRYGTLAEHYSWLAGTAPVEHDDGTVSDPGDALRLPGTAAGEGTLTFRLGRGDLATDAPAHDLLLAMVYVDDDGEVRWARKVPLSS